MRATHTPPSHSLRHNEHGAFSREACQAASCSRSASLQPVLASSVRHPTLLVPHQQRPGLLLRRVVTLCWSRRRRFRRYWLHARPQPLGHCNSDTRELRPLGEQHEPVATSRGLDSRACTAQDSIRLYQRPEEPLCRRLVSLCWSKRRRFRHWLHARPKPLGHCNNDTRELDLDHYLSGMASCLKHHLYPASQRLDSS